jgi:hypothetical protein
MTMTNGGRGVADELKSALDAAARDAGVGWSPSEVAVNVHRHADRRRRRRRLATVSAAGALVAVSIGGALVLTTNGDDKRNVSIVDSAPDTGPPVADPATTATTVETATSVETTTTETATSETATSETAEAAPPTVPVAGTIEPTLTIANPPLTARANPLIQWVHAGDGDDHIVYWGGHVSHDIDTNKPPFNDGAVWSRSTAAWVPMSESPLPGGVASAAMLPTGELVLSNDGHVATYNLATNSWHVGAPPRPLADDEIVTAVGSEAFFLPSLLAYDVHASTWRSLASPDIELRPSLQVVGANGPTGDALLAIQADSVGNFVGQRYDISADSWSELPQPPASQIYDLFAVEVVAGSLTMVSTWEMSVQSFDLDTLEWAQLPSFPEFPLKCTPRLSSYGSLVIGSVCGQLAILEGDHWRPFIVGSTGSVFDVLPLVIGQIVIRGALFDTRDDRNSLFDILHWSPLRLAGLTVEGALEPRNVTSVADGTIALDLVTTGCSLSISRDAAGDQQLFADAVRAGASAPESVTWWNPSGAYELTCPSADAYAQSLAELHTEGEHTTAANALDQFAGQGPWASVEAASTDLAGYVADIYGDQDTAPSIGLGYFPDGANTFTIESVGLADDSVSGQFFTVTLQQTGDQWTIASATVASVCARGVSTSDQAVCV